MGGMYGTDIVAMPLRRSGRNCASAHVTMAPQS